LQNLIVLSPEMIRSPRNSRLFSYFQICSDRTCREHAVGGLTIKNGKSWLLIAYQLMSFLKVVFSSVLTRIGPNQ